MSNRMHDAVVLGAGVVGLSTAWSLARRGLDVLLIEQHRVGHMHGSSHGATRITRTSYGDAAYVDLMAEANGEDWPALERDAGEPLIRRMPGLFFGPPGGQFDAFAAQARAGVERVSRDQATARFPELRFESDVLIDSTAGVVRADATCRALARRLTISEETRIDRIDLGDPVRLRCGDDSIAARRLVITAGPWTSRLLPRLATHLRPVRQDVGYFRLPRPLPLVFVHLGATSDELRYVLPASADDATILKAARHRTAGDVEDPDATRTVSMREVEAVGDFLGRVLTTPPSALVATDTCFYTLTPNEDYVLDLLPDHPNVAIGAGFSGHGFKLAPTCGRILADLVTTGRSFETFERWRAKFALPPCAS